MHHAARIIQVSTRLQAAVERRGLASLASLAWAWSWRIITLLCRCPHPSVAPVVVGANSGACPSANEELDCGRSGSRRASGCGCSCLGNGRGRRTEAGHQLGRMLRWVIWRQTRNRAGGVEGGEAGGGWGELPARGQVRAEAAAVLG